MKSFCPSCGSLVQYAGPKPKFCASCGNSLDSFSQASKIVEKNQNEEEEEVESIPDVSELEFEVQRYDKKETVGGVMEAYKDIKPPEENQNSASNSSEPVNKEQFLENWKKEAGSIRPK